MPLGEKARFGESYGARPPIASAKPAAELADRLGSSSPSSGKNLPPGVLNPHFGDIDQLFASTDLLIRLPNPRIRVIVPAVCPHRDAEAPRSADAHASFNCIGVGCFVTAMFDMMRAMSGRTGNDRLLWPATKPFGLCGGIVI
jgi:hypothetical protein